MRFLTRSMIALLLAALTFALLGYAVHVVTSALQARSEAAGRPAAGRERVFTVRALTMESGRIAPEFAAFGEVRSQRILELRAPVAGRVLEMAPAFEDGAPVMQGQFLFSIDPADAEAALALARADMARAEAELRDAERALLLAHEDVAAARAQYDLRGRALERRQELAERGVATEAALEEAELALVAAQQALVGRRQAEAQAETRRDQAMTALDRQIITLSDAQRRLEDTRIYAPITGMLSNVALVAGRIVNTTEQLARIIDPDALEVVLRLSTTQYLRLLDDEGNLRLTGAEVALAVSGYEITSPGQVLRASATVEAGQSGRRLFVQISAPRGFRPGDFVTVRLQEPVLDAVALVPAAAVNAAGNVLVINADNRLDARPVTVLRRQGDDLLIRAPELSGLEIVREITPNLGSGILVRPLREGADGSTIAPEDDMINLDADRRARLIRQVEANTRMPEQARARMIAQLSEDRVPAQMVHRLENGSTGNTPAGQVGGGPGPRDGG